jgi:two-component system sensor histidine kinase ChvG
MNDQRDIADDEQGTALTLGWTLPIHRYRKDVTMTRRTAFAVLVSVVVTASAIGHLSHFRSGLIDARVQGLLVQGEIIARAIAASATAETDTITINPEMLPEGNGSQGNGSDEEAPSDRLINPGRVAPVLHRLISPSRTRARIYDREGVPLLDSRNLCGRGEMVLRCDLPPSGVEPAGLIERAWTGLRTWFELDELPPYPEPGDGNDREVAQALAGQKTSVVSVNDRGEVIVSVAVPVRRFHAVSGALLLSTQGGDLDQMVTAERLAVFKASFIVLAVTALLGMLVDNMSAARKE